MSVESKPNGLLTPPEAPEPFPCLMIVFDPKTGFFGHKLMPGAPVSGLVNHLEIVKFQLVSNQMAAMRQKPGLLLPDGSPSGY